MTDSNISIEKAILLDVCLGVPIGRIVFDLTTEADQPPSGPVPDSFLFRGDQLARMKARHVAGSGDIAAAVSELVDAARALLPERPPAVTDKPVSRYSDDRHAYQSLAKYAWPNPATDDQLPYVTKDGAINPDCYSDDFDNGRLVQFAERLTLLALAAYLGGDRDCADKAAEMLRVWFVAPDTRQAPHFRFAQVVPGQAGTRGAGTIEARFFIYVCEAVQLLAASQMLDAATESGVRDWFATFLTWMRESEQGRAAAEAKNNIGFWYDLQCAVYAHFTGRPELAAEILRSSVMPRMANQIGADGELTRELSRAFPHDYVAFTVAALAMLSRVGERSDLRLWDQQQGDGRSFQVAHDWLLAAKRDLSRRVDGSRPPAPLHDLDGLIDIGLQLRAAARAAETASRAATDALAASDALKDKLDNSETRLAQLSQMATRDASRAALLEADYAALGRYADELEQKYLKVLRSRSWRLMAPVRELARAVKGAVTGRRPPRNRLPDRPMPRTTAAASTSRARRANSGGITGSGGRWRQAVQLAAMKAIYGRLPQKVRSTIPGQLKHWARHEDKQVSLARRLEDKLWGGFSRSALTDLEQLQSDPSQPERQRVDAAWSLARWHAVKGDFETALRLSVAMRELCATSATERRQIMLEASMLCRTGRGTASRAVLKRRSATFDTSVELMLANSWNVEPGDEAAAAEANVLRHINNVYRHYGLTPIGKRDAALPLSLDNLTGVGAGQGQFDPTGKVTIIVPAYNAAATIVTALRSIAEQTWTNLEVLVVDDASTDDTAAVVAAFCATDARFRLIRQESNRGSYVCRNAALREATGAFVTIHDADDWSHPERIALQVKDVLSRPGGFNLSQWARATDELRFWGPWRPSENLVNLNMGSLLFRRELTTFAGGWDEVRISADREFIGRLEHLCEVKSRPVMLAGCPLTLGRDTETSLTRHKSTHVSTAYHGVRRDYHEGSNFWHAGLDRLVVRQQGLKQDPPYFPHPPGIGARPANPSLDVLVIGDFHSREPVELLRRLVAERPGAALGLLHYFHYDRDVTKPLKRDVRRFAWDNGVRIAVPGESLVVTEVIVASPAMFEHPMDRFPGISHKRLVVIDQVSRGRTYDRERARQHLRELFEEDGQWLAPDSPTPAAPTVLPVAAAETGRPDAAASPSGTTRPPARFKELIHLRMTRVDPFLAGNKLQVREKLLALGAPVAELYATYDVASQIDLAALPDEFVLKPHNLWSKTGVFVLQRLGGGVYWDAMSQSELTAQQIADAWERLSQEWSARGRAPVIMAEERIRGTYRPDAVPLDYKFNVFDGEVRVIEQIDRNVQPTQFCFFHRDFKHRLETSDLRLRQDAAYGEPVVPQRGEEMLEVAQRVSRGLRTPFIRVDMYDSQRGPIVGELTPTPGGPYYGMFKFGAAFDASLVASWRQAAERLGQPVHEIGVDEVVPLRRKAR